jgi:hypothetical protein
MMRMTVEAARAQLKVDSRCCCSNTIHPLRHPPHAGNHHLFDRDFDLFLGRKGKGGEAANLEGAAKEFASSGNIDREWQG